MIWIMKHPRMTPEALGFIPSFFSEHDPRGAREQINENYAHGGGWHPFHGFKFNEQTLSLQYPGDPPTHCLAATTLRSERILFFEHSWLLIIQPDGTWEVARID